MKIFLNCLDIAARVLLLWIVLFKIWFPTVEKIDRLEADLAISNEEVLKP